MIYLLYEKELQNLFCDITNDRFEIPCDNPLGEVDFGNGRAVLSSGYQAIIRLLVELLYYQDMVIRRMKISSAWIVIDELDEFLSPGYARKIFSFLKENFPEMELVITTHSCDLIVGAQNANLVVLDKSGYEVIDVNDYQPVSEVQIVFDRIFGVHSRHVSKTEDILRRLLNNKLNNAWTGQDQIQLEILQKEKLTAS